ncbi:MAG: ExeA family protein [Paracoccaceae bacterium]
MSRTVKDEPAPEQVTGFYLESFGFSERPFTLVPDPTFIYWSDQHKRAFSVLEFGILSRAPITLVTGAVGCGKTTLLRQLLKQIEGDAVVGLISNAQGGRGELIQWSLHALGVKFDPDSSYVSQFQCLQDFLIETYAEGQRVILIFDEAQNLSEDSLEELRMLTNINSNKDELIQLVLVGQKELREMIKKPELRQLSQRISASFHLRALSEAETHEFIVHRLRIAGGTGEEFDEKAKMLIYDVSQGIPRLVNQVCDMSLLYAWSAETRLVDASIVQAVIDDGVFFGAEIASGEAAE